MADDPVRKELEDLLQTARIIMINWFSGIMTDYEAICAITKLILYHGKE